MNSAKDRADGILESRFNPQKNRAPEELQELVSEIASYTQTHPDTTCIGMAAVMSGILSRRNGPYSGTPPACSPRFNLAYLDVNGGSINRLFRVLIDPVELSAEHLRDRSRMASSERILKSMKAEDFGMGLSIAPRLDGTSNPQAHSRALHAHFVLLKPTIYLRDPDVESLQIGLTESFDRSLLVNLHDSELFYTLSHSPGNRAHTGTAAALERLLRGCHCNLKPENERNSLRINQPHVSAIASMGSATLQSLLTQKTGVTSRLLRHFIYHTPARSDSKTMDSRFSRVRRWSRLVADAVDFRTTACSLMQHDETLCNEAFVGYERDLDRLAQVLPPETIEFLTPLRDLPLRLAIALKSLTRKSNNQLLLQAYSDAVARRIVRGHIGTLIRNAGQQAENIVDFDAERMHEKISSKGPIDFRTLLRTYAVQRKEVHEPILNRLIENGRVIVREDGRLEARCDNEIAV